MAQNQCAANSPRALHSSQRLAFCCLHLWPDNFLGLYWAQTLRCSFQDVSDQWHGQFHESKCRIRKSLQRMIF